MKLKKLISAVLAAALLISSTAAFNVCASAQTYADDIYGDTLIIEDFAQDYVVVLEEELLIVTVNGVDPEDFMNFFQNPEMTIHYGGTYVGTGSYLDFAQKQYDIIVFNDLNGDGMVTAADARITLRASASLEDIDILQFFAADVDSNQKITAADARAILRIAAGLE